MPFRSEIRTGAVSSFKSNRCRKARSHRVSISFPGVGEIVKQGDAVGLGPHANLAGVLERLVIPFERGFAIERDFEMTALKINAQGVPLAARDFDIDAFLFGPFALDRVIN